MAIIKDSTNSQQSSLNPLSWKQKEGFHLDDNNLLKKKLSPKQNKIVKQSKLYIMDTDGENLMDTDMSLEECFLWPG